MAQGIVQGFSDGVRGVSEALSVPSNQSRLIQTQVALENVEKVGLSGPVRLGLALDSAITDCRRDLLLKIINLVIERQDATHIFGRPYIVFFSLLLQSEHCWRLRILLEQCIRRQLQHI